jgi:arsenate reductase
MANSVVIYGISNCDTVKKACKWLDRNDVEYRLHDFRKDGISGTLVKNWLKEHGQNKVLNKRSTTWRNLNNNEKLLLESGKGLDLLIKHPTLIKRPVLMLNKTSLIGFNEKEYKSLLC